jgi:hypothetical protein
MLTGFKINSALVLCTAFIFRLLFVNGGAISSLNTNYTAKVKSPVSTVLKTTRPCEASDNTKNSDRPVLEICETGANDDDKFKAKPSLLATLFYSQVTGKVIYSLQNIIPPGKFLSGSLPQRYLLFQVFRI